MAELILAILCICLGVIAAGLALLSLYANAIGGVTNRAAVNLQPVVICTIIPSLPSAAGSR